MRVETPQPLMDWDPFLRQTSVTKKMLPVSLHLGVLGCWLATSCNPDDLCPAVFPLVTKLSCQDTKEIKGEISSGLLFLNWWPAAKFAQINASLVRTVNMLGCEVGLNDSLVGSTLWFSLMTNNTREKKRQRNTVTFSGRERSVKTQEYSKQKLQESLYAKN